MFFIIKPRELPPLYRVTQISQKAYSMNSIDFRQLSVM